MYSAYFDESGTDGSSESTVVAGYVASDEQWQNFEWAWRRALDDAEVSRFHMRDFAHSLREFKDWRGDEDRRVMFLRQLIDIIRRNTRHGFSNAVIMRDYQLLNRKYQLAERTSPYVICAVTCAADIARWCKAREYVDPVNLVFEDGVRYKGEFLRFYAPTNFHKISYAKQHEFIGFQAADFVAWEQRKLYSQLLSGTHKRHRQSFSALLSVPNKSAVYEQSYLERWCQTLNTPLRTDSI
jgi:hypothetical protein